MKNKKIVAIILALIILAGIIITYTKGLNFDLNYSNHKTIDIYIGQEFENKDIYQIVEEVIGKQKIEVQKVELYEDMISINVKDITDEQLENLNTKINEKYGTENSVEEIGVTNIPNVRGRDIVKPYILPVAISFAIIIIFFVIYNVIYSRRGREINTVKTVAKSIATIIIVQLLYLSILAITRVEINTLTMPISVALYVITTIMIINNWEKEYSKKEK